MTEDSGNIVGWIGARKRYGLTGWAYNPRKPEERVKVQVLVNGEAVATLQANERREHLSERGFKDTDYGFSCPMPDGLKVADIRSLSINLVDYPGVVIKGRVPKLTKNTSDESVIDRRKNSTGATVVRSRRRSLADEAGLSELLAGYQANHAIQAEKMNSLSSEIDQLKDRNRSLTRFLDNRKKEVDELKKSDRDLRSITASSKKAVGSGVRQMWGGYADEGQRSLLKLANSGYVPPINRAAACYELARFYADTGKPFAGARMMSDARRLSKSFMRGLRPRLLEAELLLRCGDVEASRKRLCEYRETRPNDPNYLIGLANICGYSGDDLGLLKFVNEIFERNGMSAIRFEDQGEPFLSLSAAQAATSIEDGPKVSVLISTYNSADFLRLAIGSVQKQTWNNIEIIVTDDCSTDGSREILREMAEEDPRLIVIENDKNYGTYGNRNRMLQRATGDFVTVHDSDDWSHPQMIEHQVKHLMANPNIRLNTTLMCRVSLDLQFFLRPSRASLEFCHMNYPGFLMRREDILTLGGWDPIMANADAEFERRVKQVYGRDAFEIINPDVAYSFFLVHENSLTQQKKMNLRSLTFGSRNEYHRQSEHWMEARRKAAAETNDSIAPFVIEGRQSNLLPFPSPNSLMIPSLKKEVQKFDVLIMSDLTLLGGTRSCNINYLRALHAMGKSVALFNWPRSDLRLSDDVNGAYRDLKQAGIADIVTWEDVIQVKRVLIHHPPVAAFELDSYPQIETERVSVLVNQLPFQTRERERFFYDPQDVDSRLRRIFNVPSVEWISISPLTKKYLDEFSSQISLSSDVWYPPEFKSIDLSQLQVRERFQRLQNGQPRFVRHSRDHWSKWPSSVSQCRKMYMVDESIDFTILGGAETISRRLVGLPETWTAHSYDSVSVSDLLNCGDVYLNFNNEVYIEEFGRNVMEALSHGLPVIAEPVFAETFGDAVLIPDDGGPSAIIHRLRTDSQFFEEQVLRGVGFVRANCSVEAVTERMQRYLAN